MSLRSLAVAAGLLASAALARTDLAGCTYTQLVIRPTQQADYASRLYYVPDTGEVCDLLDCGGGRAPPKTTVPGCPLYAGTDTYRPSYVDPETLGDGVLRPGTTVVMATEPVMATALASVPSSSTPATSAPSAAAAASSSAAAASASSKEEQPSVTTLTGTSTRTAQVTGAASSAGGAAKTTSPSAAAGAMRTVGAVLGPCVVAAVAALV